MRTRSFNLTTVLIDKNLERGFFDKTAIYCENEKISYSQLSFMVNRLGNALKCLQVKKGDIVFLILGNDPQFIYTSLACMRLGAIPIVGKLHLESKIYDYIVDVAQPKLVIYDETKRDSLLKFFNKYPNVQWLTFNSLLSWDKSHLLLSGKEDKILTPADTNEDSPAFCLLTSGSTGYPKLVVHRHIDMIRTMENFVQDIVEVNKNDRFFSISKLSFTFGFVYGFMVPFLIGAATVLLSREMKQENVISMIKTFKPTMCFSVPTVYRKILLWYDSLKEDKQREECGKTIRRVKYFFSSGETLPPVLFTDWKKRFNSEILNVLGSTEMAALYIVNRPGEVIPGSTGRPVKGFLIKIVDENRKEVICNAKGTLFVSGKQLALHYLTKYGKKEKLSQDNWYNTKDVFSKDEKGCYFFHGRTDNLFKVSGEWVYPTEIEEFLLTHKAVRECAVIGEKDERDLVKPKAYIALKNRFIPSDDLQNEIKSYLLNKFPKFKVPKQIIFINNLPKTTTGKVNRESLKNKSNINL